MAKAKKAGKAARRMFVVDMGQAFQQRLPQVLRAAGATVYSTRLDGSSTLVLVKCSFCGTADRLQRLVWDAIPGPAVGVREVK